MEKIDFFIVGAQKSATTTIYEYLKKVDNISLPKVKEAMLFSDDNLFKKLDENIPAFFDKTCFQNGKTVGIADVKLLFYYEKTAERIYNHNPEAKILIFLRNPIIRAYSSYNFSRKRAVEDVESFEKAILLEEERIVKLKEKEELIALTYLNVSLYYSQVNQFINLFGEKKVKLFIYEEFIKDTRAGFIECLNFLNINLPTDTDLSFLERKHNVGGNSRFRFISKLLNRKTILNKVYKKIVPLETRISINQNILHKITQLNSINETKPKISQETYDSLCHFFYEDVKKLSEIINKDLNNIWNINLNPESRKVAP